jgi:hypothetical protein
MRKLRSLIYIPMGPVVSDALQALKAASEINGIDSKPISIE